MEDVSFRSNLYRRNNQVELYFSQLRLDELEYAPMILHAVSWALLRSGDASIHPFSADLLDFLWWIMTIRPWLAKHVLRIWVNWRADNATTTKNDKKPVYILWDLPCFNNNWDICLFSLELRHILDTNHLWSQNQLTAYKNITRQCKCLRTWNFFYWLGMTKPALHYMQGVDESLHFNKMTFL